MKKFKELYTLPNNQQQTRARTLEAKIQNHPPDANINVTTTCETHVEHIY